MSTVCKQSSIVSHEVRLRVLSRSDHEKIAGRWPVNPPIWYGDLSVLDDLKTVLFIEVPGVDRGLDYCLLSLTYQPALLHCTPSPRARKYLCVHLVSKLNAPFHKLRTGATIMMFRVDDKEVERCEVFHQSLLKNRAGLRKAKKEKRIDIQTSLPCAASTAALRGFTNSV